MANIITITVMGNAAAPYNDKGPAGNAFSSKLSGSATGVSEQMDLLVANIINVKDYFQPTTGTQYPAVKSIVRYRSVNPTNGRNESLKFYVNETRAAIRGSAG